MHQWQIFLEPADTDEKRTSLGTLWADTMSDALNKAAQYYEKATHDLVAVQVSQGNALHIPVKPTLQPCEECGTSPALQYELVGITGVLCRECLQKEVDVVNRALKETSQGEE